MEGQRAKSLSALGFLTVIESRSHGLFGGYLLLDPAGRPLEFHCTAPVKPSRAQQILYGPTLDAYLYAEQIGRTLVEKAKRRPPLLLTDQRPVLDVEAHVRIPAALVVRRRPDPADREPAEPAAARPPNPVLHRLDGPHDGPPGRVTLRLAGQSLSVSLAGSRAAEQLQDALEEAARRIDFREPFERIEQAIGEAQRIHGDPQPQR